MFHFFTKIDSISTDELEKRLKFNIQLIDVRTPSEFRRGHIKEAQNVPLSQIGQFAPAKKETIYVICHSGMRSKMAAKKLKKKGYVIIGVSIQDEKSHKKFIEKNELPFPLIADTDLKLVKTFGVYGEKKMYGRTYMGTFRTTFIINEDGVIERIIGPKQIKTKDHAAQILAE